MDQSAFNHKNQRVLFTDPRNPETVEGSDDGKMNDLESNINHILYYISEWNELCTSDQIIDQIVIVIQIQPI